VSWLASFVRDVVARLPGGRRLKAELDQSRRQRDLLRARLDKSEKQRQVLRRRLEIRRQRTRAAQPDEAVLEHVLPLRHAAMLAANHDPSRRSAAGAEADGRAAREAAFAERSASYREALAHPESMPAAHESVVIAGLTWWMPAQAGESEGIAQRLAGRRVLPLREILETRELAVGRVMIDIGANVGTTSIPRVLLGDFACVYAIEPDPANYACLVRNIVGNGMRGLVLPDRVAIGDSTGEMTLRSLKSGTHHLVMRASDVSEHERVAVPCLTLDAWIDRMGIDLSEVAFIKSDTQGWDARVLAGAARVLARKHIAWQIEFSPAMLERSGRSMDEVYSLLEQHFTHFIDLRSETGAHVRPASQLRQALAYIGKTERRYTNVLLYSAG
jgi:FkbM family methyltransferase